VLQWHLERVLQWHLERVLQWHLERVLQWHLERVLQRYDVILICILPPMSHLKLEIKCSSHFTCGTTMKHLLAIAWLVSSAYAFVPQTTIAKNGASRRFAVTSRDDDSTGPALSRQDFVTFASTIAVSSSAAVLGLTMQPNVAQARGRATFEVAYRKFTPRIVTGGEFYSTDMKKMIAAADFAGIKNALQEPPSRTKEDLSKSDSGVAARARQAGQFSDARVLVAADLYAASFSEASISIKTKKMKEAVTKMRNVVQEMESIVSDALGESSSGGLFGLGGKKVDKTEAAKKLRALYVEGGNAYNEYVLLANENLAMQFDKLAYIK
jgi:hypothetical protein